MSQCHSKIPWYKNLLPWTLIGAGLLIGLSYLIPELIYFRSVFFNYIKIIAIPILLGFFVGGIIDRFIPSFYITPYLASSKKRSVFYAITLGFLMSACSHGMLAIAMELHKKGASAPAVISFLLASPWANFPITILFFGFFGWKAVLIILAAMLVAAVTGLLFLELEKFKLIESNPNLEVLQRPPLPGPLPRGEGELSFSIFKDIKRRFKMRVWTGQVLKKDLMAVLNASWSLAKMVLGWIVLGMLLASIAGALIPEHFFHQYMGPNFLGLLATLGAATVIEICSEGSAPLAFELYRQTGAIGNSLVFLMAGVATDYTEIGLLWKNVGRRTALWMVALTVPQVLLLSWILNQVF